ALSGTGTAHGLEPGSTDRLQGFAQVLLTRLAGALAGERLCPALVAAHGEHVRLHAQAVERALEVRELCRDAHGADVPRRAEPNLRTTLLNEPALRVVELMGVAHHRLSGLAQRGEQTSHLRCL